MSREDLSFYDALVPHDESMHMVDFLCGFLPLLGINNYSNKMEFPFDEVKYKYAQEFVLKLPKRKGLIALNVDASNHRRTLYKEQIVKLANSLKSYTIVILSLPTRQAEISEIISNENLANCILSYETKTIFDATELMHSCDILISPDTSFIHIASAIDLPTIGIYNKNKIAPWGPRSSIKYLVCSNLDDEVDEFIDGFSIDEVVNCVNDFFNK
ncbi:hypothetical protein CRU92_02720 [Arcobacter sp. FW59]|nr:hypothetical protein CRU92_02720 [Arcobacter sp. FW59]